MSLVKSNPNNFGKILNEFVVEDRRMGKKVATALSGFVAGVIFATIIWLSVISLYYQVKG